MDEVHDYRMKVAGKVKADQLRATGAQYVVSPCANCKKQLRELIQFYELPMEVVGLHDLVLRAIRLEGGNGSATGESGTGDEAAAVAADTESN